MKKTMTDLKNMNKEALIKEKTSLLIEQAKFRVAQTNSPAKDTNISSKKQKRLAIIETLLKNN
ncbi:MAG TPA: hypothetical protein VK338_00470 [Candidatus Nitrosocosmicus sp.]|nr:hypothetical protein [Candidatus Nitrosocosmicus sp.]